jgi:hypothetical protein
MRFVDKLNGAINRAVGTPGFKERLAAQGQEAARGTPEDFADVIRRDSAKWLALRHQARLSTDKRSLLESNLKRWVHPSTQGGQTCPTLTNVTEALR